MATKFGLRDFFKAFSRAVRNPKQGLELFWRRLFPFGIKPKDPEAYRIGSWSYGRLTREPATQIFPGIERADVLLLRALDRDPWTSLDIQEALILCALVKFTEAKKIVEIGTFEGNTALNLAANTPPDALIITIDMPPDWNGRMGIKVPELKVNVTEGSKIGRQFEGTTYAEKIRQVFSDSADLDWNQLPGPFDLVFIDGCHDFVYVQKDTANALQSLRPGGLIVWHDYGMYEDVSRAVDEASQRMTVRAVRGTRLAVGFVE